MPAKNLIGPLFIAAAAVLWATDALFRAPTVESLDPTFIVFSEHVIGVALLLPWILLTQRKTFMKLGPKEWFAAAIVGVGGSAIATVFFTASFRYVNPSVVILLQKLQPVMVVLLAFAFLGERPARKFYGWAALAFGAGLVLSFPDFNFGFLHQKLDLHSRGILYSAVACAIWAVTTVAGKSLLGKTTPSVATFWRFSFGLGTLVALLLASGSAVPWATVSEPRVWQSLAYMGLIPGLIAMISYYKGMIRTPASVTTFVELLFPVGAVILNTLFLKTPLDSIQIGAGSVLLFAVTMISL